jgi:cysteine-rich repeat protein
MRLGGFLFSTAIATMVLLTQACSLLGDNEATKSDRLCTPNANVFCRCADRAKGTKRCREDGKTFDACRTSTSGECVGGEIPDERTNQEISPNEPYDDGDDVGADDPPNAIEACPGKSIAALPGIELKLEGDTTTATGDRSGKTGACAVGKGGKDHVYRLIPSGSGTLEVKVQGSGDLKPLAYIRTSCDDEASQASCGPPNPNATAQLKLNVVTGKDYFLIVDGASSSAGKYVATVKLTTSSFCGDGKVSPGEACDDANKVQDDGCSNDCQNFNGNPESGGSCPGQPVHLWSAAAVSGTGSTNGYGNSWSAPSASACGISNTGTNQNSDHVYEVTPHADGDLVVTLTGAPSESTNLMLSARRTCSSMAGVTENMCANATKGAASGLETMRFPVTANTKVYVAVDGGGSSNDTGDYKITFQLQ